MRYFIISMTMLSSSAYAVDASIQDHYKTINRSVPSVERVCQQVQVPVQSEGSGGGAVLGALVGNVLGAASGLGDGSRTIGTVIGAVAGNEIGRNTNQGYRIQEQCSDVTRYNTVTETVYSHSTITFVDENNRRHVVRFSK